MWDDGSNECYVGLSGVLSLLAKAEKGENVANLPPEWLVQTKNLSV